VPLLRRLTAALFLASLVSATAEPVSFSKQIAPIFAEQCLECHRAEKAKGAYRLDTFERLLKAGDSEEKPITPGKPESSSLYALLTTDDDADRMPKKADPLPEKHTALIKQWISEGAKFDGKDVKMPLTALIPAVKQPKAPEKYPRPLPVTALALNGDGKVLATSGYREVTLWDPATGKLLGRIADLPERILGLSFIAGGPWLAVVGGLPGRSGEVWLVNVAQSKERKRLAQLRDCALCVVTTPDGKIVITGGADNQVRAFSLPEGKPLWNIEAHADWVLALGMSFDGTHVASASRDRTAKVIATATGTIEGTFTGHSVPILSIAFRTNGKELISGTSDGEMRRWDMNGSQQKDGILHPCGRSEILSLGFIDQDTAIIAAGNGQVNAVDIKARKTKARLTVHADRVNAVCMMGSGDTRSLISASHDGEIRVVQIKDTKEILKFIGSPGW
jgi:WD40 repeat protein